MTSPLALQALVEVHNLVASDGYAATFQSFGAYRTSLMQFITERFTQLKQAHDAIPEPKTPPQQTQP